MHVLFTKFIFYQMVYRLQPHSSHTNLVKEVSVWVDSGSSERRVFLVDVIVGNSK